MTIEEFVASLNDDQLRTLCFILDSPSDSPKTELTDCAFCLLDFRGLGADGDG